MAKTLNIPQAREIAKQAFAEVEGRTILASQIIIYTDAAPGNDDYAFDPPIRCRIRAFDDCGHHDTHYDPRWEVEVLERQRVTDRVGTSDWNAAVFAPSVPLDGSRGSDPTFFVLTDDPVRVTPTVKEPPARLSPSVITALTAMRSVGMGRDAMIALCASAQNHPLLPYTITYVAGWVDGFLADNYVRDA